MLYSLGHQSYDSTMDVDVNPTGASSLKEFQAFLGDLLQEEGQATTAGNLKPLTDGLGLESPKRPQPPVEAKPAPTQPTLKKPVERKMPPRPIVTPAPKVTPPPIPRAELARVMDAPEVLEVKKTPPPLPTVSLVKRAASLFLDQVFVQTLWVIALVITSNIFTGFETGLSAEVFQSLSKPLFFRFAVLEFATLWLAYLAISLGIFNMTFGMWVWGIRISYGNQQDENYGMRKLMRILWSFIFYAPLVPSVLLAFRNRERNLLDILSGSNLYLSE